MESRGVPPDSDAKRHADDSPADSPAGSVVLENDLRAAIEPWFRV